ncbi:hypothetical protein AYO47_06300 [Planctomyces sp. SCGC AG-212-M04]|nr:hypothetical protein AYO47_06300 [Planctomyces sp. SCGC AG-212-M04]
MGLLMRFRTRPSLIARLRNLEDADAWREFQESYQPFIRRVGVDAGASRETLGDLVQVVLLTIVRVIPRFAYDPDRGRFRSWLARVVRSRCSDLARKNRRDVEVVSQFCEQSFMQHRPEHVDDESQPEAELRAAMAIVRGSARPSTWQCFQQHILDHRPAVEVAQELGVSVNAVYLNSARTLKRVEAECRRLLDQGQGHESRTVSLNR